jgi:hypothetical protein
VTEERADRLDTGGVAIELGEIALPSPASVSVHDDRDVARQLIGRQQRGRTGRKRRGGQGIGVGIGVGRETVRRGWRIGRSGEVD